MRNTQVREGQNLLDIAVSKCGDVTSAFEAALMNNISITEDLVIDQNILLPDVVNEDVVDVLASEYLTPASADDEEAEILQGIGYMTIGLDFIVS